METTMPEAREKARALLAAATPWPWAQCMEESPGGCYGISPPRPASEAGREMATRDAALIAAAPGLLAALCDENDALRAELAQESALRAELAAEVKRLKAFEAAELQRCAILDAMNGGSA